MNTTNLAFLEQNSNAQGSFKKSGKAPKMGVNFFQRGNLLYVRLTFEGSKKERSLGLVVQAGKFDNKKKLVQGDEDISTLLKSIEYEVLNSFTKSRIMNLPINLENILKEVLEGKGMIDNQVSFESLVKEFFKKVEEKFYRGEMTEKTFKRYVRIKDILIGYFRNYFKSSLIKLDAISFFDVKEFIEYLIATKGFSSETIRKYIQLGSTAYELARQKKLHEHNPFKGHKLPKAKNYSHNHLTDEELKSFSGLELNTETYSEVRDYFIFQCLTGLNYCDLKALKQLDVKDMPRGRAISSSRSKTGTPTFIPLLPMAEEILKRYSNPDNVKCFNVPTNQHYNRVLKELSVISRLGKNLTTSFARKTFINIAFEFGLDMDTIGILVGHRTAKMTEKYYKAKQSPNRAFDGIEKLRSKL